MKTLRLLLAIAALIAGTNSFGTHMVGGEIRYQHVTGTTYTIEVLTWTDLESPADRPEVILEFSNGDTLIAPRIAILDDPGASCGSRYNLYSASYTFPGFGLYGITMEDPNRSGALINVPNAASQAFHISAMVLIDPGFTPNNSARFNTPQPAIQWEWSTLVHDPMATDPVDGDSLSFALVVPQTLGGNPLAGYEGLDAFTSTGGIAWCDPQTGRLLWNHPTLIGNYSIAIRCTEWRDGTVVGYTTRDMTLCVEALPTNVGDSPEVVGVQICSSPNEEWVLNTTSKQLVGDLFSTNGAHVGTFQLPQGRTVLDTDQQHSGVYMLVVSYPTGQRTVHRMVRP